MPLLMPTTYAGKAVTTAQIRGTARLLRYYDRFLASDFERCRDPENHLAFGFTMTKDQARRRLGFLINTAINRKAGIPDVAGRKQDPEYQNALRRECREINDWLNRRIRPSGLNGRRFQTDILQRRYGHLLADDE